MCFAVAMTSLRRGVNHGCSIAEKDKSARFLRVLFHCYMQVFEGLGVKIFFAQMPVLRVMGFVNGNWVVKQLGSLAGGMRDGVFGVYRRRSGLREGGLWDWIRLLMWKRY